MRNNKPFFLGILGVIVVVAAAIAFLFAYFASSRDMTCTVVEKYEVHSSSETSKRVNTEECGVLSVDDSNLALNFNSADDYAALKPGETVDVTVYGWRVNLLSWFPNVTDVR